jgi:hypothetical protein
MYLPTPKTLDEERLRDRHALFARAARYWPELRDEDQHRLSNMRERFIRNGRINRREDEWLEELIRGLAA